MLALEKPKSILGLEFDLSHRAGLDLHHLLLLSLVQFVHPLRSPRRGCAPAGCQPLPSLKAHPSRKRMPRRFLLGRIRWVGRARLRHKALRHLDAASDATEVDTIEAEEAKEDRHHLLEWCADVLWPRDGQCRLGSQRARSRTRAWSGCQGRRRGGVSDACRKGGEARWQRRGGGGGVRRRSHLIGVARKRVRWRRLWTRW